MKHSPSLPEIVRANTNSVEEAVKYFVGELDSSGAPFNYTDAPKRIKSAFKGLTDLDLLTAIKAGKENDLGTKYNIEVVSLAAPLVFGRNVQVIDFPAKKLSYNGRFASYRISFLFIENGVVKTYFLQPRKKTNFTKIQFSLYATVTKKFLLDTEFYDMPTDVEIVDVSQQPSDISRSIKSYSLADLNLWNDSDVQNHFDVVAEALDIIERESLVSKVRRPLKDSELPLFD